LSAGPVVILDRGWYESNGNGDVAGFLEPRIHPEKWNTMNLLSRKSLSIALAAAFLSLTNYAAEGADKAKPAKSSKPAATSSAKAKKEKKEKSAKQETSEAGFVSLFDGKTLKGWTGGEKTYSVVNGLIVANEKGHENLTTVNEYSDFIVRLDFKLTPGANSGVGLRVPADLKKQAAFEAIEIQILDDGHEMYKSIKDYQFCGSFYGVVPAKQGHLKPVGEWNSMEITAKGSHVRVVLNGTVVVDADGIKAGTPKTLDGQPHPGLHRTTGHIALLGHNSRVEFRNLRVKDLAPKKSKSTTK